MKLLRLDNSAECGYDWEVDILSFSISLAYLYNK